MKTIFMLLIFPFALNISAKEYTKEIASSENLKSEKLRLAKEYMKDKKVYNCKVVTVKKNGKYMITIKASDNVK